MFILFMKGAKCFLVGFGTRTLIKTNDIIIIILKDLHRTQKEITFAPWKTLKLLLLNNPHSNMLDSESEKQGEPRNQVTEKGSVREKC